MAAQRPVMVSVDSVQFTELRMSFDSFNALHFVYSIDADGCDTDGYHKSKAKRVRTTFTEEQLQVLQANFQIDSNPDGQDLERIASVTGLSKRVTQVWFQNSRARQKKHIHSGEIDIPFTSLFMRTYHGLMHKIGPHNDSHIHFANQCFTHL